MISPRKLRCAIYTRKSTEEGLDQAFNSLDAQREACAAYIQSQRHEGWKLVSTRYDDGGYSGGNLERPALRQLLMDIDAGTVDLIVVYKIDRLTRSLSDFAKIVERLDARSASFVSVTQSFNTTTSMGRLTLNVLLSFAQFEREVTGERIRDKIAASKRKGMWMGGFVPMGYDSVDRKLVINAHEAAVIRRIYMLYRTDGNIAAVQRALLAEGITSKQREHAKGRGRGGVPYSSGALFNILRNPLYSGRIAHKETIYPGQHEAIVTEELWTAVQNVREGNQRKNTIPRQQGKNPLLGLIVDDDGRRYQAVHTTKGGRRYRYYVSHVDPNAAPVVEGTPRARLPADELEARVADRLITFFRSQNKILNAVSETSDDARSRQRLVKKAAALGDSQADNWGTYRLILRRVLVRSTKIDITVDRTVLRQMLGCETAPGTSDDDTGAAASRDVTLTLDCRLYKTGHELRLVIPGEVGVDEVTKRDPKLIRFIARGRRWYEELISGQMPSIRAIARREGLPDAYVSRVLQGALLAPDIVERILAGRQPVTLTVESLRVPPPLDWNDQREAFGIARK